MSGADQAAIDAAWDETIARVGPHLNPAGVEPPTPFHAAQPVRYGTGASQAAVDALWADAVAAVNVEEGIGPVPSDARSARSDRFR